MHKACLDLQKAMKHCKIVWGEYYILKMDIKKYLENIDKDILYKIMQRKIKDKKLLWITKEIIYSNEGAKDILQNIEKFLKKNLQLELNQKTQIFKSKQGVNFCGYKINEYRLKIRDRGKRNLKKKVKILKEKVQLGEISSKEAKLYLAGHLGYIKIANVKNLTDKLFTE